MYRVGVQKGVVGSFLKEKSQALMYEVKVDSSRMLRSSPKGSAF